MDAKLAKLLRLARGLCNSCDARTCDAQGETGRCAIMSTAQADAIYAIKRTVDEIDRPIKRAAVEAEKEGK